MTRSALDLQALARLMADGLTVRAAAAELYCHENTIYNTLRRHGVRWWPVGQAATGSRLSQNSHRDERSGQDVR